MANQTQGTNQAAGPKDPSKESKYPHNYPSGIYRFSILNQKLACGKHAGKPPYLALEVGLVSLKKPDNPKDSKYIIPEGARRTLAVYFTPKTIQRSKAFLKFLGFDMDTLQPHQLDAQSAQQRNLPFVSFTGKEFDGTIKPNERGFDEVGFFERQGGGGLLGSTPAAPAAAIYNLAVLWKQAGGLSNPDSVKPPVSENLADPDGGSTSSPEPFAPVDDYNGEF